MNYSVKTELAEHIINAINDKVIDNDNRDEWHFHCFNEDYYIIGYYQASQWLKSHDIRELEAANICQQYEIDNFGECKIYDNSESVVNMLAYIYGEKLFYSFDCNTVEELKILLEDV